MTEINLFMRTGMLEIDGIDLIMAARGTPP